MPRVITSMREQLFVYASESFFALTIRTSCFAMWLLLHLLWEPRTGVIYA